jgi:Rps23 Pro-64 3,4-dihydroxylase Tpa1-like proline 4-hydroxylase
VKRSEMINHILNRLDRDRDALQSQWVNPPAGTATRHCVIDNLLPDEVAQAIYDAFPRDGDGFLTLKSFREHKRTSAALDKYPPILADITYALQNPQVIEKVSEVTCMMRLEPDPHLYAGGLSMMFKDEFLNPHIDNSHEKSRTKYRRLNLLYYVTPCWTSEHGGNLELWDESVTQPVTIVSLFNRLALMETNSKSYHSVSPVLVEGPRCCVSNYYFSEESPTGESYYHVTSYTGRPGQHFRRALGLFDNAARDLARKAGARRATDEGYSGELANSDQAE